MPTATASAPKATLATYRFVSENNQKRFDGLVSSIRDGDPVSNAKARSELAKESRQNLDIAILTAEDPLLPGVMVGDCYLAHCIVSKKEAAKMLDLQHMKLRTDSGVMVVETAINHLEVATKILREGDIELICMRTSRHTTVADEIRQRHPDEKEVQALYAGLVPRLIQELERVASRSLKSQLRNRTEKDEQEIMD